jgi:hypothetical protein
MSSTSRSKELFKKYGVNSSLVSALDLEQDQNKIEELQDQISKILCAALLSFRVDENDISEVKKMAGF